MCLGMKKADNPIPGMGLYFPKACPGEGWMDLGMLIRSFFEMVECYKQGNA